MFGEKKKKKALQILMQGATNPFWSDLASISQEVLPCSVYTTVCLESTQGGPSEKFSNTC